MRKAVWSAAALMIAVLALVLAAGTRGHSAQAGVDWTVNTSADHAPDGCAPLGPGDCTLREALLAVGTGQTIGFDINGPGPHTITIDAAQGSLPQVVSAVLINGYTQHDSQTNSSEPFQPGNADIRIVLDGQQLTDSAWGLWVVGDGVVIQGLSFVNFAEAGIKVGTLAGTATIQGNYLGVMPDGVTAGPNKLGVWIRSSQNGNLIGGSLSGQRNLISGNTDAGIRVTGGEAVAISGNWIGTNAAGTLSVPNGIGIDMAGGDSSTIGGNNLAAGNLVSGNTGPGIRLSTVDGSHMNVKGNRIGVQADNVAALGNGGAGVLIDQGAFLNTIGGEFNVNEHNTIAYNVGAGVGVTDSAGVDNYIDPNELYSNGGLGADLRNDGLPLANDHLDGDGGNSGGSVFANRLMNYPTITSANYDGTTLTVFGQMDTAPNRYTNMFFIWNEECDESGYGEGHHFIDSGAINSGPTGVVTFSNAMNVALAGTVHLVMQASDPESSSEYSPCYELDTGINATASPSPTDTPPPTPVPTPTPTPTATPTASAAPKQGDMNCDDSITMQDFSQFMTYLVTGARGPAPDLCPSPGDWVGQTVFQFMDTDCSFNPTPGPDVTPPATNITPKDALALLVAIAGIDRANGPCPDVGERIS